MEVRRCGWKIRVSDKVNRDLDIEALLRMTGYLWGKKEGKGRRQVTEPRVSEYICE